MNSEKILKDHSYDFLRNNPNLGDNIVLLGFGGSHAYGTNIETSDIDIRGCALNSKREILTGDAFEQVIDSTTDTVIYSFNKLVHLLSNCNPNVIEMLGLREEDYILVSDVGLELLKNRKMFLSRKAIKTFGGYAYAQLRKLDNKAARVVGQNEREEHILHRIENASVDFSAKYFTHLGDKIYFYVDETDRDGMESEIFMDVNLTHFPLRDFAEMLSEMSSMVKNYDKVEHQNNQTITRENLGKHMMHLLRLYMMCIDILEKEEIITYRKDEHELLMSIRNGDFLDKNDQPTKDFFDLVNDYEHRMKIASQHTSLPENVNHKEIMDFVESVNMRVVAGNK